MGEQFHNNGKKKHDNPTHKGRLKKDIKNCRLISLLSNIYKLFSRIMINRLGCFRDSKQPKEQAEFRSISIIDHIHTINQLKHKCLGHEKAFESVEINSVLKTPQEQGINSNYITLIKRQLHR